MKTHRSIAKIILDIIEIQIPCVMFVILFLSFVIGVITRYCFHAPLAWTYEVSSICFLGVGILAGCVSFRNNEHVCFDMFYNTRSRKVQCIMRIISNLLIIIFISAVIPSTARFLYSMRDLKSQVINYPRWLIFTPFAILFISSVIRAIYRLTLDIKSYFKKNYEQNYQNGTYVGTYQAEVKSSKEV